MDASASKSSGKWILRIPTFAMAEKPTFCYILKNFHINMAVTNRNYFKLNILSTMQYRILMSCYATISLRLLSFEKHVEETSGRLRKFFVNFHTSIL